MHDYKFLKTMVLFRTFNWKELLDILHYNVPQLINQYICHEIFMSYIKKTLSFLGFLKISTGFLEIIIV